MQVGTFFYIMFALSTHGHLLWVNAIKTSTSELQFARNQSIFKDKTKVSMERFDITIFKPLICVLSNIFVHYSRYDIYMHLFFYFGSLFPLYHFVSFHYFSVKYITCSKKNNSFQASLEMFVMG